MSTRPPHPPSATKLADLVRRARLTYTYHGPRELAIRAVTFPLRPTPLGAKLGYGSRYGSQEAAARRWYAKHKRPVTAVIPSYGDPGLAIQAARSLVKHSRRGMLRAVIVDDGTPDPAHVARLRAFAGAEVVVLAENGGFAKAANAGIARAPRGQDVVVVNSDVVARPGWLERLQYAAYRDPRIGVSGPKLLYPDQRIQSAGSYRNLGAPEWFDHRYRFRDTTDPQANIPVPLLGTTGACMYLRRDFLDEVGTFDEAYGMAYEDMDLCLRGWEAGWQTTYAPRSTLLHLESQTRPTVPGERELASQRLFWSRWRPWFDERDVRGGDGLRVIYVTEDTGVGGGHRDIFEHVNRLRERGHDAQVWSLGDHPDWFALDAPVRSFADYKALMEALEPERAIKVATWWNTGHPVWRASVRRGIGVFFVQDVETSYYPDDETMRHHVLASYRQEFRYMTISGWNADRLAELGIADVTLVPPGIDLETFRPLDGAVRREDTVLALGRGNPLKNFPLTVDAWRALGDGTGAGGPELTLFGVEPDVAPGGRVRYLERPSDAEVNALFNECTVFLQTSTHEGFCLPPLEAMATGAAVVCTDAHGNRDFCVDGENCLMPAGDAASVAGAVRRLLDDPGLRARLGAKGIETAAEYAWERRIDELETFYAGLVHVPAGGSARSLT